MTLWFAWNYGDAACTVVATLPSLQNRAESTVLLHVSHSNLKAKFFELRLDRHVRAANTSAYSGAVPDMDVHVYAACARR
jgi:hypothetical protein